jgi:hypothetical protein
LKRKLIMACKSLKYTCMIRPIIENTRAFPSFIFRTRFFFT